MGVVALQADVDQVIESMAAPIAMPLPGEIPAPSPSLSPILASPSRVIVSSRWRNQEHITVLEMRAVQTALRWLASRPDQRDSRVLLLVDSAPCVFALSKGRSSSRKIGLLRRLRSIAAVALSAGLTLVVRWIPSASNPADAPSRVFDPDVNVRL
jgi:hypothetical protein